MLVIKDILKCGIISFITCLVICAFLGIVHVIFISSNMLAVFNFIKSSLYYIGSFGLFISAGFFIQKNGTRPLSYNDKWREHFSKLNLGLVIMFISLFMCFNGMVIQYFLEKLH